MPTITSTSFPSTNVSTNFTQLGVMHNGDGNLSVSSFNGVRSAPYYCRFDGSGSIATFNIDAQGGANWSFYTKGVSGNSNANVKIDGSPVTVFWEGSTFTNGTFPFYSSQYYSVNFNIPAGVHVVSFTSSGVWAMDDAVLTIQDPPFAENYISTGELALSGDNIIKLNLKHVSISNLILSGVALQSTTSNLQSEVNYLITGPSFREIKNTNKYFKLEITNDAEISENLNIELISSDRNSTFSSIGLITNDNRYVEFLYYPSEVGKHYINAICTNENVIFSGNKFKFLSTSSDPEEGLYPKIKFRVDFALENLSLNLDVINTKTIEIPNVSNILKQGDEFTLYGEAALYVKKNYINGIFNCLRIINI